MWGSVIAVVGTLAGATLTFWYQSRQARETREFDLAEKRREDRIAAVADLGAAFIVYRHCQVARQKHKIRSQHEPYPESVLEQLSHDVREARGNAWAASFRLQLRTNDMATLERVSKCFVAIKDLNSIHNLSELNDAAEAVRQEIQDMVQTAREFEGFVTTVSEDPAAALPDQVSSIGK